jgi:hypothetical protein
MPTIPTRSALLALAIAACVALPATAAGAGPSSDQELADQSVLTSDDVPSVFTEEPSDSDSSSPPKGASCKALRKSRAAVNAAPNKEVTFNTADGGNGRATINNQVSVFESAKQAKRAYAGYADADTEQCFQEAFEAQFGATDDAAKVTAKSYKPDLGDASIGYELEISFTEDGEPTVIYADLEVARVGRGINLFGFFNPGNQPPSDDVVEMTETGIERLTDAL